MRFMNRAFLKEHSRSPSLEPIPIRIQGLCERRARCLSGLRNRLHGPYLKKMIPKQVMGRMRGIREDVLKNPAISIWFESHPIRQILKYLTAVRFANASDGAGFARRPVGRLLRVWTSSYTLHEFSFKCLAAASCGPALDWAGFTRRPVGRFGFGLRPRPPPIDVD